jgi:branched-chain amino acid transport system ATP-binding protein
LGLTPALSGTVRFCGERVEGYSPDRIARMGLAVVPEGRQIFPTLSVQENLLAFAANRNSSTNPWTLERVYALFPRLAERHRHMGNQLSGGEQQMLAIGRALMTNPHLLVLDEATEGLAPLVREDIWRCLHTLRGEGQSILVIDKYVQKLVQLADQHTIIERGQVVWQGASVALEADHSLWHRYIGV